MARKNPHRRRPTRRAGTDGTTRGRRSLPPTSPSERKGPTGPPTASSPSAASGPSAASDPRIASLLGEIAELRLSAATHLTIAAAAMDAGRPDIAAELIEAQQRDVTSLRLRTEELLHVEGETAEQARREVASAAVLEETELLHSASTPGTKSLRRSPRTDASVALLPRRPVTRRGSQWSATGALLAVAAAVIVAVAQPLGPAAGTPDPQEISASVVASLDANVTRSYEQLQEAAQPKGPRLDVEQATARLHADLQRLLPMAASDPEAAKRVLAVLRAERALLVAQAPAALSGYTADATRIVTRLRELASPAVLAVLPALDEIVPPAVVVGDALPGTAQRPQVAPAPAATTVGGSGGSSAGRGTASGGGQGSSAGTSDGDAPAAPVVTLPDPAQLPPVTGTGSANDGGDKAGEQTGNGSGGTGSGGETSTGGSGDTGTGAGSGTDTGTGGGLPELPLPLPLPLPQLPAPPVPDTGTN